MIEQFNNFVRLASIDSESLEEFGYSPDDVLNHENNSIYTLKMILKSNLLQKKIDINETGFDEETFAPISEKLMMKSIK